jgi:hypothetical protein
MQRANPRRVEVRTDHLSFSAFDIRCSALDVQRFLRSNCAANPTKSRILKKESRRRRVRRELPSAALRACWNGSRRNFLRPRRHLPRLGASRASACFRR